MQPMTRKLSVRDVVPYSAILLCLVLVSLMVEAILMTEIVSTKDAIFKAEDGFNLWDFKDRKICTNDRVCSKVPKHMFDFLHDNESISIFRGKISAIPYFALTSKGKITFISVLFAILVILTLAPLWRIWREDELTSVISLISQGVLIVYLSEFVLGT